MNNHGQKEALPDIHLIPVEQEPPAWARLVDHSCPGPEAIFSVEYVHKQQVPKEHDSEKSELNSTPAPASM